MLDYILIQTQQGINSTTSTRASTSAPTIASTSASTSAPDEKIPGPVSANAGRRGHHSCRWKRNSASTWKHNNDSAKRQGQPSQKPANALSPFNRLQPDVSKKRGWHRWFFFQPGINLNSTKIQPKFNQVLKRTKSYHFSETPMP